MPLSRGDVFASFEIARYLGSGVTGTTYLAHDPETATWVALKIVRAALSKDADFRRRLHDATENVARIGNPYVAQVLDFGRSRGRLWVATEYIDGNDIGRILRQRFPSGIPHQSVCLIAHGIGQALDAAHSRRQIHGDVKPSNILIGSPFSDNYRVLLTDFGHGDIGDLDAMRFVAPELVAAGPNERGDQFALAGTVFELLTASAPFVGVARAVADDRYVEFDTDALKDRQAGVPGLERVFATAFALDPAARFDTCDEFVSQLTSPGNDRLPPRRISDQARPRPAALPATGDMSHPFGVVSKPPADSGTPSGSLRSRRSVVLLAAAGVLLALALTVAGVVFSKPRPSPPAAAPSPAVNQASPSPVLPAAAAPGCAKLDATVSNLTLRQKLAQLLMVGVKDIDDARAVVNGSGVGGIMIASWTNLDMLSDGSLHDLQATPGPLPLAVSVDEEGGRVQRLKAQLGDQLSPRVLAETRSPKEVHDIAFQRGTQMREYGITVDFAPVLDVTQETDHEVIGDRSFGADPTTVIEYAGAYAQGLRDAGLLPVLKHFPGHGHGSGDSHLGDVTTPPIDDLQKDDLIPYHTLTTVAPVAVMIGHLEVPGLTTDQPASLTAAAYSMLRQGHYGGPAFNGMIFTDDLSSMKAISDHFGVADAALRALQAGADTALWTSTDQVPAVLDRLEQAVSTHELDMARVNDALSHVAAAKNAELACTR